VGSDIGGFVEAPTAELYTRWLQLGVFYPFMRSHTAFGTPDQEPWSYGPEHEAINRRSIELRYELLPHVYNAMKEASETGVPAIRPLFLEFPADGQTWGLDDELMFGRDLLVAPVLRSEVRERDVYLPAGDWYDFWTGHHEAGGRRLTVPVTIESLPLFVRGGGFVFRQPVVQHTGAMAGQPLDVFVFPAVASEASLYEDDGETTHPEASSKRRFAQSRSGETITIDVGAAVGPWRPKARDLRLHVRTDAPVGRVLVDGKPAAAQQWAVGGDGFAVVTLPDRFDAFRVALAR